MGHLEVVHVLYYKQQPGVAAYNKMQPLCWKQYHVEN